MRKTHFEMPEEYAKYFFWKQVDPQPFSYSLDYKQKQSTDERMSMLRLGWLACWFSPEQLRSVKAVDIGCGSGEFGRVTRRYFGELADFDVSGDSISREELEETPWDLVILSDVLEHMPDIEYLFRLNWKHAFISIPQPPLHEHYDELSGWRHFKPDEHLWILNTEGLQAWLKDRGCYILQQGFVEDIIRRPQEGCSVNIGSVLAMRRG